MYCKTLTNRKSGILAFMLVLSFVLGGATQADAEDWTVSLLGTREDTLKSSLFEEAKAHSIHYLDMKLEKKGTMNTYSGMPLIQIAAMVDGSDDTHPYKVDRSLWKSGYDITVTAADGYSATFNTSEVDMDAVILADRENGLPIPPTLVGEIPSSAWVRNVAEIELSIGALEAAGPSFELILDINGKVTSYSIRELETLPYYVEEKGSYTTSAGTTYTHLYGGVKFPDLLNQFMRLKKSNTVILVAMDGYEMTYSGEQILDASDGVWILAFKQDGEYIPQDPGYIRTVKVGPKVPNITGHLSVRMIEQIVVREKGYEDFTLAIDGKVGFALDRQTIQSCVSCHNTSVFFERKGQSARYTGFPLWRILAYSDDPDYAPHNQDSSIISYRKELAADGYEVELEAADGFKITVDSRELDGNNEVILGMYKEEEELPANEWPLVLVWDKDASVVPEGVKPIRQITSIRLILD